MSFKLASRYREGDIDGTLAALTVHSADDRAADILPLGADLRERRRTRKWKRR